MQQENTTITDSHLIELEKYKRILDCMSESVWMWNDEEETIYANPNFCNLLWYKLEEMLWRKSYDFWDEESIRIVQENNKYRKKWETSKYEWLLKAKDWTLIPVFLSWTPVPGWWTVWIMTDLREVKSLKKVEEELKQLNKTKDEFISIVWHELRTPLTAIKWYLSMILDWDLWEINDIIKRSLNHSFDSTNRLIELVNDVLCISKIESWNMNYYMEDLEIVPIINAVYNDIKFEGEKRGINIELDIDDDISWCIISVDENKLKQVLLNLLTNALKFTKEWWKVTIKVEKNWNDAIFSIIDTWEWIPKDKMDSLFEKFTQVESALQRKNTSWLWLWLAICRDFIENFWWKIEVESEIWKWSTFFFKLKIINNL